MPPDGRTAPLPGRTAIVTGAAVRLGRAVALELADAGCDVLVHHHSHTDEAADVVRAIEAKGRRAVAVRADLSDPVPAAELIIQSAVDAFGGCDILVNSAAIFEDASLADTAEELFDRHVTLNVKAPFFLCREFLKAGERVRGRGEERGDIESDAPEPPPLSPPHPLPRSIVNILDWRAERPPADYAAYTISKSGLWALTKTLAKQLAPHVRVNAVAPGAMLPPPGTGDEAAWARQKLPLVPLNRVGGADPVARAVRYLCDADFVTGEVLHVTGGEQL